MDVSLEPRTKANARLTRALIISGWVATLLLMFVIVGIAIKFLVEYPDKDLPPTLAQWASNALTFLFVTFGVAVKDYIVSEKA